ncbi:MAG: AzlD domain-containing protein [Neomegalonema sp.]|nr:AzlD domain-containing protein [Neomegalonema sp.]
MNEASFWIVVLGLGAATYLIRLSFLGILGGRALPAGLVRLLSYVPVAVLPALIAPMVLFPKATGGSFDLPRLLAALIAFAVAAVVRSALAAILSGMGALWLISAFLP